MGCACSTQPAETAEYRAIEQHFLAAEQHLGLNMYQSEDLGNAFKRFAYEESLTDQQLRKALESLSIDSSFLSESRSSKRMFYEFFRDGRYRFASTKLIVLSVVFGAGSVAEKARNLFLAYDRDLSKSLDKVETLTMLEDLVDVVVVYLGELACMLHTNCEIDVQHLVQLMAHQKKNLIAFFRDILFFTPKPTLSLEQFQKAMQDTTLQRLFVPSKLRKLAYERAAEVAKQEQYL